MSTSKPLFRVQYGPRSVEEASGLARELTSAGLQVELASQATPDPILLSVGALPINWIEIHAVITDAIATAKYIGPFIAPFIPTIIKSIKKLAQTKQVTRDDQIIRVRIKANGNEQMIIDFNDKEIVEREHLADGPRMIIPAATRTTPVQKLPAKKAPAKKLPAKKAPAKKAPAKKAPAKKLSAKKAPAKKLPAKKAPAKKAPRGK